MWPFIGISLLAISIPLAMAFYIGKRFKRFGLRISGIGLAVFVVSFIALSAKPNFVEGMKMDTAFATPGDYHDRMQYGWPNGIWRTYTESEWNTWENQFNSWGLILNTLFFGYWTFVILIPAILQLISNHQEPSNKALPLTYERK